VISAIDRKIYIHKKIQKYRGPCTKYGQGRKKYAISLNLKEIYAKSRLIDVHEAGHAYREGKFVISLI